MPLKKPHNGLQNGDGSHDKDSRHFGNGSQQQNMDLNDHEGEQNLPSVLEVNNDSPVVNGIGMWFKQLWSWGRGVNCSNGKQRVPSWKNHCYVTKVIRWEAHKQVSCSFTVYYTISLSVGFSPSISHGGTQSGVGVVTHLRSVKFLWGNGDQAWSGNDKGGMDDTSPGNKSLLSYVCTDPVV